MSSSTPESNSTVQSRLGKGMIYAAWILALALLSWLFSAWLDARQNPNRSVQTLVSGDKHVVTLVRNPYGHYRASGYINSREVEFMVDTGATTVAVPASLEAPLGLQRGVPIEVRTANGSVRAFLTRLDSVRLGTIELRDVKATINPSLDGNEVLLGMSFLKQLEFTQRGDSLILSQSPR
jgi:aspartyl protease family protein